MKKLILSLIFPIINIAVSLVFIVGFLNARTPIIWNFGLSLLAGGVLPIISRTIGNGWFCSCQTRLCII